MSELTNPIVETGLSIIKDSKPNFNSVSVKHLSGKEVGLQILQFGLAQSEAKRLEKLMSVIDYLEKDLFDLEKIKRLPEQEKIARYQLAQGTVNQSINYIKSTINNINWTALEVQLLSAISSAEVEEVGLTNKASTSEKANRLLREIAGG